MGGFPRNITSLKTKARYHFGCYQFSRWLVFSCFFFIEIICCEISHPNNYNQLPPNILTYLWSLPLFCSSGPTFCQIFHSNYVQPFDRQSCDIPTLPLCSSINNHFLFLNRVFFVFCLLLYKQKE